MVLEHSVSPVLEALVASSSRHELFVLIERAREAAAHLTDLCTHAVDVATKAGHAPPDVAPGARSRAASSDSTGASSFRERLYAAAKAHGELKAPAPPRESDVSLAADSKIPLQFQTLAQANFAKRENRPHLAHFAKADTMTNLHNPGRVNGGRREVAEEDEIVY